MAGSNDVGLERLSTFPTDSAHPFETKVLVHISVMDSAVHDAGPTSVTTSNVGTSAELHDDVSENGIDEMDAEIDQLDSDSDRDRLEYELESDDGQGESGKRVPGQTVLPVEPIVLIIEDTRAHIPVPPICLYVDYLMRIVQKPSIPMAQEAVFAISIATVGINILHVLNVFNQT